MDNLFTMKIRVWFVLTMLAFSAWGQTVKINLNDFNAVPATNRTVTVQALSPTLGNLNFYTSDSNGCVYLTPNVQIPYTVTIKSPPAPISFALYVQNAFAGTNSATNYTSLAGVNTYPAAQTAPSWQAAYATFALTTNGNAYYPLVGNPSNYVNNSTLLTASNALVAQIAANTNSTSLVTITNIAAYQAFLQGVADTNFTVLTSNTLTTAYNSAINASSNVLAASVLALGSATTNNLNNASNAIWSAKQPASSVLTNLAATGAFTNGIAAGQNLTLTTNLNVISFNATNQTFLTNGFTPIVFTSPAAYIATNALPALTNGFVQSGITNGLASISYVATASNSLIAATISSNSAANTVSTNLFNAVAASLVATNGYILATVTNVGGAAQSAAIAAAATTSTNLYLVSSNNLVLTNGLILKTVTNLVNSTIPTSIDNASGTNVSVTFGQFNFPIILGEVGTSSPLTNLFQNVTAIDENNGTLYSVFANVGLLADGGPGFYGGENFNVTYASSNSFSVFYSTNANAPIQSWQLFGEAVEFPISGTSNSKYGITLTQTSRTYYVFKLTSGEPVFDNSISIASGAQSVQIGFTADGNGQDGNFNFNGVPMIKFDWQFGGIDLNATNGNNFLSGNSSGVYFGNGLGGQSAAFISTNGNIFASKFIGNGLLVTNIQYTNIVGIPASISTNGLATTNYVNALNLTTATALTNYSASLYTAATNYANTNYSAVYIASTNGNASQLHITDSILIGAATNLVLSTNVVRVIGSGSGGNGTYTLLSASLWTNTLNPPFIISQTAPTSFFIQSNAVSLYSANSLTGAWSVVSGIVPVPLSFVGSKFYGDGVSFEGWIYSTNLNWQITNQISRNATTNFLLSGVITNFTTNTTFSAAATNAINYIASVVATNFANSNSWLLSGNIAPIGSGGKTNIVGLMNTGATEAAPLFLAIWGKPYVEIGAFGFPLTYQAHYPSVVFNPSDADQNDGAYPVRGNNANSSDAYGYPLACAILGGGSNTITGTTLNVYPYATFGSTILNGYGNVISNAFYSVAGGYLARVSAFHDGSFVWSDHSSQSAFSTTSSNQFLVRAAGGVGINTNNAGTNALRVFGDLDIVGKLKTNGVIVTFGGGGGLTALLATNAAVPSVSGTTGFIPTNYDAAGSALASTNSFSAASLQAGNLPSGVKSTAGNTLLDTASSLTASQLTGTLPVSTFPTNQYSAQNKQVATLEATNVIIHLLGNSGNMLFNFDGGAGQFGLVGNVPPAVFGELDPNYIIGRGGYNTFVIRGGNTTQQAVAIQGGNTDTFVCSNNVSLCVTNFGFAPLPNAPSVPSNNVYIWNSNKVLYGVSSTKTNLLLDLR